MLPIAGAFCGTRYILRTLCILRPSVETLLNVANSKDAANSNGRGEGNSSVDFHYYDTYPSVSVRKASSIRGKFFTRTTVSQTSASNRLRLELQPTVFRSSIVSVAQFFLGLSPSLFPPSTLLIRENPARLPIRFAARRDGQITLRTIVKKKKKRKREKQESLTEHEGRKCFPSNTGSKVKSKKYYLTLFDRPFPPPPLFFLCFNFVQFEKYKQPRWIVAI